MFTRTGRGGGVATGIGVPFEHFLCPLSVNFATSCGFVFPRKGCFIRFKLFSIPEGQEFEPQNCKKT